MAKTMSSPIQRRDAEIIKLYRDGYDLRTVGLMFGLTGARVHQILAARGVPRRRRGRRVAA